MTYFFFRRGKTLYWSENQHVAMVCRNSAFDATSRGFPEPEDLVTTNQHPSQLGYAWRLNCENENMG